MSYLLKDPFFKATSWLLLSLLALALPLPLSARGAGPVSACCAPIYGDPFRSFDRLDSFEWFGRIDLPSNFSPSLPVSLTLSNPDSGQVYFSASLPANQLQKNGAGWLFPNQRGTGPFLWLAIFPHKGKWQVRIEGTDREMRELANQPGRETYLLVDLEVEGKCYEQALLLAKTHGPPGWKR